MKHLHSVCLFVAATLLALSIVRATAAPLGTAFTYQGQLAEGGNPASGFYDLQFTIYDAAGDGAIVAGPLTNSPVGVTNGLFTVALDFGAVVFAGDARWLEIGVRTNGGGVFTTLSPRQELTPSPHALYAPNAGTASSSSNLLGVLPNAQLAGTYTNAVVFANPLNSFVGSNVAVGASVSAGGDLVGARLNVGVGHSLTGGNASIAGGFQHTNSGQYCSIGGGYRNTIQANGNYGVIGGGQENLIQSNTVHGAIGGGWRNALLTGTLRPTIAGGSRNTNAASWSSIGGGTVNTVQSNATYATIAGGEQNTILSGAQHGTIGGGLRNSLGQGALRAMIGGGVDNAIGDYANEATIGGGWTNTIGTDARRSTIAGGYGNAIQTNASYAAIGGGIGNVIQTGAESATIGGGAGNTIEASVSTTIVPVASTIGGGISNLVQADAFYSTIDGGIGNTIQTNAGRSAIGGGGFNTIAVDADHSVIPGGLSNTIYATDSAIGGGVGNIILPGGVFGTIPGGLGNTATTNAFAAGSNAQATNQGAFVWADSTGVAFPSVANDEFAVRCQGGARFVTGLDPWGNPIAGVSLPPSGTAWAALSDRNVKKDFQPVDGAAVLETLSRVPIQRWHYQWEAATATAHIGPMAQDFKAAFYPGRDDKTITTLEFDGVALAAIQGLNQKVEEREAALRAENVQLKQELSELKRLVNQLSAKLTGGAK